jgi:recombinational DNA repair protein RecR
VPIFDEAPEHHIRQKELMARLTQMAGTGTLKAQTETKEDKDQIEEFEMEGSSKILTEKITSEAGLKEVILATSVNPEGEHTASYIAGLLKQLKDAHGFRISTLGRGLSTGTELEYSDSETLKSALQNRR